MIFITNEKDLVFDDKIFALYFCSNWMPYHKKMMVMIDKIEQKYKDIVFYAIDVDNFKSLCTRFSIRSIPTIVVISHDEEIKRINGLVLTSAFKAAFADIYSKHDTTHTEKDNGKEG
jgi:thiol-disulfide isomerase/thioredoxin